MSTPPYPPFRWRNNNVPVKIAVSILIAAVRLVYSTPLQAIEIEQPDSGLQGRRNHHKDIMNQPNPS
jgi:hypothetical protein